MWLAIKALAALHDQGLHLHVVVYSGNTAVTAKDIIRKAQARRDVLLLMSNSWIIGG